MANGPIVCVAVAREYDLYSDEFRRRTFETYAEMRERDPVLCQPGIDGETMIWFATHYEDAVQMLLDDERFVRDPVLAFEPDALEQMRLGMPPELEFIEAHTLNKDGADHRRLRRLVTKAFTPRMIEGLRPRIQEIADDLLDAVEHEGDTNLLESFAFPLPITVIAELLGIPVEDRERFRHWSDLVLTPALTPEAVERFAVGMREFVAYLHELFAARRADPGDDLVTALLAAEDGGDTLSERELFSMVVLLIIAGHKTTVSLIGTRCSRCSSIPISSRRCKPTPRSSRPQWRSCSGTRLPSSERSTGGPRPTAEIALTTLLRRLPGLRLNSERNQLYWRPVPLFRSLASLPVAWH